MGSVTIEPFGEKVIAKRLNDEGLMQAKTLNINKEDFDQAWFKWKGGMKIQDAFPTLNKEEREFLLTGLSEADWNELFKGDDDES